MNVGQTIPLKNEYGLQTYFDELNLIETKKHCNCGLVRVQMT